ncbi:MAG: hypothetical protein PUB23_01655 [Bacilli bacterium]|nr:hypothetical protein [Bacilli bacterium]
MILSLISKEYKENKSDSKSLLGKITKLLLVVLTYSLFIALEVYIFLAVDKKLNEMKEGASFSFLILFLFITLLISSIISVGKARKSIFKEKDRMLLLTLPIVNDDIVIAKVFYIYTSLCSINFLLGTPLLITYGALNNFLMNYYIFSVLYPFIISLFGIGLTMMLLLPYNYIYNYLKDKNYLQIIIASILVISLCFVYKEVLNLFLKIISDSKLDNVFSASFVNSLSNIASFLVPIISYVSMLISFSNIVPNITILLGSIILSLTFGLFLASYLYAKNSNKVFVSKPKKVKKQDLNNFTKMLIRKELILLFRNSNYIFSYTALIIMQPFLAYVVISSLKLTLYSSMSMFLAYFPELINGINITLILLFSSIINSTALDSLSREEKGLIQSKLIPCSPSKQSLVKIAIPSLLSSLSLLITLIVLISSSTISVTVFFISLYLGILFTIALNILGLYIDLKKLDSSTKINIGYLSSLVSFLVPLSLCLIHFILTFIKVPSYLIYISEVTYSLLIFLPLALSFKKVVSKGYLRMKGAF